MHRTPSKGCRLEMEGGPSLMGGWREGERPRLWTRQPGSTVEGQGFCMGPGEHCSRWTALWVSQLRGRPVSLGPMPGLPLAGSKTQGRDTSWNLTFLTWRTVTSATPRKLSLCAKYPISLYSKEFMYLTHELSPQPIKEMLLLISTLQVRKCRHRETGHLPGVRQPISRGAEI